MNLQSRHGQFIGKYLGHDRYERLCNLKAYLVTCVVDNMAIEAHDRGFEDDPYLIESRAEYIQQIMSAKTLRATLRAYVDEFTGNSVAGELRENAELRSAYLGY